MNAIRALNGIEAGVAGTYTFPAFMKYCHLVFLAVLVAARLSAALPPVALKTISVGELQAPTCVANAHDGSNRLFVCEQLGQIRIIQDGMLLPKAFLDLSSKIVPLPPASYPFPMSAGYDERGLLSIAFHPGFANASSAGYRKFYVFYSAPSPNAPGSSGPVNCTTVISEFQVSAANPNVADAASERIVLSFDKPQMNHNGGQIEFGPDGFLYFSAGDGGGANDTNVGHTGAGAPPSFGNLGNGQDVTNLLGKIHRIDPLGTNGPGGQYGIPADNPFASGANGARKEIYAYGLRNPWRFSFDTGTGGTGKLFAADVGQNKVEEIDIIISGGNYGWHAREGAFSFDSAVENALINGGTVRGDGGDITLPGGAALIDPIAQYAHPGVTIGSPALPNLGTSITGGYRYRGAAIAGMAGQYVFADYNFGAIGSGTVQGTLLGIEETSPGVWSTPAAFTIVGANALASTHILAMGRDEQGELYIATEVAQGPQNDPNTSQPTGGMYKILPASATKSIKAAKDNSIFSEDLTLAPLPRYTSDALGHLYAGKTGTNYGPYLRRALVSFDVAGQVPAGSTIQSAQLQLNLRQDGPSAPGKVLSVYRLSETWGEGTSMNSTGQGTGAAATTGDATWTRRFYNTSAWSTAGGSRSPTASTTQAIGSLGALVWASTSKTVSDVQGWLDTPTSNAGWIILGDESTNNTACQFYSVQTAATPAQAPTLVVSYLTTPVPTRRESWLQQYFPPGHYVDDQADLDGDGLRNLAEYAFAFSPLSANPPGAGLQVSTSFSFINGNARTVLTMTFRRDPRATDLTYKLQTSPDAVTWTTILQSSGGNPPTGTGFVAEADIANEAPIKLVTGSETLSSTRRFARVQIIRQ